MVDNGVERNGGFTRLAVADDQFALTSTDRDHGINCLNSALQWLIYALAPDNTGSNLLYAIGHLTVDSTLAIDRLTQRIDHATFEFRSHRNLKDTAGASHLITFA